MSQHPIIHSLLQQPALLILLGAFAVLMALVIPAYFYVYRPRSNSTEWIDRLDRRSFQPFSACALCPADIIWSLLSMICAAFLCFAYFIFRFDQMFMSNPSAFLFLILRYSIPIALIALSLFLLLRIMYGKTLPAILCAVIGAVAVSGQSKAIALFTLSLLFLYLWVCAPYDAPLFFNALWLAFSAAAYGAALLFSFPLIWTAPFYIGVYIVTQVVRWKRGDPDIRGKKLAGSIVLLLLLMLCGFIAVWLAYCIKNDLGSPVSLLRSFDFYRDLFPALTGRLATLLHRPSYWNVLVFSDSFIFIAGIFAIVPLLHGLFKLRDTRCLFLLLLLPCLLAAWYFSACYALIPLFILIIGWSWSLFAERDRPLFAVGFAATILLFLFAELFIH